jgi:hypothetical protein
MTIQAPFILVVAFGIVSFGLGGLSQRRGDAAKDALLRREIKALAAAIATAISAEPETKT